MPELPEMEHYRMMLSQNLVNRTITGVTITREKSINMTREQFERLTLHRALTGIRRRAKLLLFDLEHGYTLVLHLMLGGELYLGSEQDRPNRTVQIEMKFGEVILFFIGLRLGYLHLLKSGEVQEVTADLGPEPLEQGFNEVQWLDMLKGKRTIVKTLLMDQHWIAGVGNCYSDEICFTAGILPSRKANSLTDFEKKVLFRSMRFVLLEALGFGGYMDPLFKGDTRTGGYNNRCMVYDREGERCLRCGTPIVRNDLSSRKSFHCPSCQH